MKRRMFLLAAAVCMTALAFSSFSASAEKREKGEKKKKSKSVSGKVTAVDASKGTLTIEKGKKDEKKALTFTIPKSAKIKVNKEEASLEDVKVGMRARFGFEEDEKTVKSVSAGVPKPRKKGEKKHKHKKKDKDEDKDGDE